MPTEHELRQVKIHCVINSASILLLLLPMLTVERPPTVAVTVSMDSATVSSAASIVADRRIHITSAIIHPVNSFAHKKLMVKCSPEVQLYRYTWYRLGTVLEETSILPPLCHSGTSWPGANRVISCCVSAITT